jgi:O-acetyl-ADP-ribose deacetylase
MLPPETAHRASVPHGQKRPTTKHSERPECPLRRVSASKLLGAERRAPSKSGAGLILSETGAVQIATVLGDIAKQKVDAVVNAANSSLLPGGGVDGAIHDAAGHELLAACIALGGCEVGDAKSTPGFELHAKWIIHTVGPIYRDGRHGEAALLRSCYVRSLEIADELRVGTIAFPAISTGAFGYPEIDAARVALSSLSEATTNVKLAFLVAFDRPSYRRMSELLDQL